MDKCIIKYTYIFLNVELVAFSSFNYQKFCFSSYAFHPLSFKFFLLLWFWISYKSLCLTLKLFPISYTSLFSKTHQMVIQFLLKYIICFIWIKKCPFISSDYFLQFFLIVIEKSKFWLVLSQSIMLSLNLF